MKNKELTTTTVLPYKLQFFAEPNPEPTPEPTPTPEPKPTPEPEPKSESDKTEEPKISVEEQIAQILAENKKLKNAVDKASSDAAEWKKKYRATLSEKEQLDLEKAEREAEFRAEYEKLKRESEINKLEKNYLSLGYDAKLAKQAAEAQFDGDTDEVFRISQIHQTNLRKQLEAEWMKNAPTPPAGNQETEPEDPFLKGFKQGL